ncbi:DEAD/DEAH box helicase family protein [Bartonella sp. HY038]|uniref:DEAD/DEAH box helicase family protein n=1 Tax=Bartonella sp. HY038 TaxID=2759660 RepID=UPI0015FA86BE|nr:DEAD/DEAH box helicase family protein [Bartonella sp. HY038]
MAKAVKTIDKSLLFNKLQELDKLGLFGENYQNPAYIQDNLKDDLRPYQAQALRYLHYTQKSAEALIHYKHLLFNMATGSGKTMVMAGAMLYLFKQYGYQNFIFFVHTDAIIQKTKENLLNIQSSKYLFKNPIEIDGEQITIEPVETFPALPNKNTLYLKLSTIHKIHEELKNTRENSVTYDELKEIPLILLGDEAHHFNAQTKAKNKSSKENEEITWEKTIERILGLRPDNRLFEFTATINLNDKDIYNKYKDKIIYQYDLKQFMLDGYSKKVMLLEANANDSDKMLDAVLLSQYRKSIAQKNNIANFKPIVLFKSNQIATSKAKQAEFSQLIADLSPAMVRQHLTLKQTHLNLSTSIWHRVINHYLSIDLIMAVEAIQNDFSEMNLLNANTNELLADYPILLNTLENNDNPIRAIFAVAKLNEGWDVLNLFDIVRISEKASATKAATDSEAQLIGRGARYYPFIHEAQKSYTRRFDKETSELSILEQLHYHTINDTAYISALHASLEQADIIASRDGQGTVEHAKLKEDFKKSDIYKTGKLYFNDVEEIKDSARTWESYSLDKTFNVKYQTGSETSLDKLDEGETSLTAIKPLQLDARYFYKALQQIGFYNFNNLKKYFPELSSIKEFIESDNYLSKITISLEVPVTLDVSAIAAKEKLDILKEVLNRIKDNITRNYIKYKGTYNFISTPIKDVVKDYSQYIEAYNGATANQKIEARDTTGKTWYVYDKAILNQLEHDLVKLLGQFMDKLKAKYTKIYLIRNDEQATRFKLTEFDGVRGFMPDFIMIITDKSENAYYQVLIEPKGDDRLLDDAWKEKMLEKLNDETLIDMGEIDDVHLVGIKFYTKKKINEFTEDFQNKLYDGNDLVDKTLI